MDQPPSQPPTRTKTLFDLSNLRDLWPTGVWSIVNNQSGLTRVTRIRTFLKNNIKVPSEIIQAIEAEEPRARLSNYEPQAGFREIGTDIQLPEILALFQLPPRPTRSNTRASSNTNKRATEELSDTAGSRQPRYAIETVSTQQIVQSDQQLQLERSKGKEAEVVVETSSSSAETAKTHESVSSGSMARDDGNNIENETEEERQARLAEEKRLADEARIRAENEARQKLLEDRRAIYVSRLPGLEKDETDALAAKETAWTAYSQDLATLNTKKRNGTATIADEVKNEILVEAYRTATTNYYKAKNAVTDFKVQYKDVSQQDAGGSGGSSKRRFDEIGYTKREDPINKRDAKGNLQPIDNTIDVSSYLPGVLPDGVTVEQLQEAWDYIAEVNGTPFYDPERNALGLLSPDKYLLLPPVKDFPISPIDMIGRGLEGVPIGIEIVSAIYALAKNQARATGYSEEQQRMWAVIRVESVKHGWFDNQPYVRYAIPPANAATIMRDDWDRIRPLFDGAKAIVGFVPFMNEYHFRCFNCTFTTSNATDYVKRATAAAEAMQNPDLMKFGDHEFIFGDVFRWIGVVRPMKLIKLYKHQIKTIPEAGDRKVLCLPAPFIQRADSAPAGKSVISTSDAVIAAFKRCGWWESVKELGSFNDEIIAEATNVLKEDPWRFHVMAAVFNAPPITPEEEKLMQDATQASIQMAPVLQAYIDTIGRRDDISGAKVLRRHAQNNNMIFNNAKQLFKRAARQKVEHVGDMFRSTLFETKKARLDRIARENKERRKDMAAMQWRRRTTGLNLPGSSMPQPLTGDEEEESEEEFP